MLTFSEQTAVSYQTLYILHWTQRKGLIKLDIVCVWTPSVTVHCSASTENVRSAVGSTWDLRPIGDRFESHPEGSVYSYHRHRVPIYVYAMSMSMSRAFLYIFLIFLKLIFLCRGFGLVYWGLTPQQQPGSYQGGEMMMKSVFWWRKPEYPEETTDLCRG